MEERSEDPSGTGQSEQDPYLGKYIAGKYRLEELIAVGEAGRVYRAHQSDLGKDFAIKVLKPEFCDQKNWQELFAESARQAARINHPNAVAVVDHGISEFGASYWVMEMVQGRSLDEIIENEAPLTSARALDLSLQILAALGEAHALGVIHGDLKPENILVTQLHRDSELVKLVGFGFANLTKSAQKNAVSGDYLPPERISGTHIDFHSDIYSVGASLFGMMTGEAPKGEGKGRLFVADRLQNPAGGFAVATQPRYAKLVTACTKALEVEPAQRFSDAESFRRMLVEQGDAEPVSTCVLCQAEIEPDQDICPSCGYNSKIAPGTSRAAISTLALGREWGRRELSMPPRLPFIGRNQELQELWAHLSQGGLKRGGVALWGEAGVGKSRMVDQVTRRWEKEMGEVYRVQPAKLRGREPLWPLRECLGEILQIQEEGLSVRELGRACNLLGRPIETLAGLAQLFEIETALNEAEYAVRRRECFASIIDILLHAGRGRPLLLVFERVDELDSATQEIWRRLNRAKTEHPVALLSTAEGESLLTEVSHSIQLQGWSDAEIQEFIAKIPTQFKSRVLENCRRASSAQKSLPAFYAWLICTELDSFHVADTTTFVDLCSDALSLCTPIERGWLDALAVVGSECPWDILQKIVFESNANLSFETTESTVEGLLQSGWLSRPKSDTIAFAGARTHELVYQNIDAARRKELHAVAARVWSQNQGAITVVAAHHRAAEDATGFESLIQGAKRCGKRFDDAAAAVLLHLAYKRINREKDQESEDVQSLACDLAVAMSFSGRDHVALSLLNDAIDRVSSQHVRRHAELCRALGRVYDRRGDYEEAVSAHRRAIAVARACGEGSELLELCLRLGRSLYHAGYVEHALNELLEGLDTCTKGEGPRAEVELNMWRYLLEVATMMQAAGRMREAKMWGEHALFQAERQGRMLGVMRSDEKLAQIAEELDEIELGERHVARALQSARYFGDRKTTADLLLRRARHCESGGDYKLALRALQDAQKLYAAVERADEQAQVAREIARVEELRHETRQCG